MFSKKLIGALGAGIFAFGMTASAAPADAAVHTVVNTLSSGNGSLRDAITTANSTGAADEIKFDISGPVPHVISLASDLPAVTQPVKIRGYTEPDAWPGSPTRTANPTVVIDAANAVRGLHLTGNGIEVRGLVVNNAQNDGIWVVGDNNVVAGSYVGTNAAGTTAVGNGNHGVDIDGDDNRVGGTAVADRNVLSGNDFGGVRVSSGTGNVIEGNYTGTNDIGTAGISGLAGSGITVQSDLNTVKDNLSSSNFTGITVSGDENTVQGNSVGTNVTGGVSIPNFTGIDLSGGDRNLIGGAEGEGNLVSGSVSSGVSLTAPGGDSAEENDVQGNVIGLSAFGAALPNNAGVTIVSSDDNTIGGETADTGNVISGNAADGVRIISNSRDNKVLANWIGTNENDADLGNGGSGVEIDDAADNRVGASSSLKPSNVIAYNGDDGVTVESGVGNAIVRNSFYDNGGLGIDLGADGTTANDGADDVDAGPNTLQNGPEIDDVEGGKVDWDLETEKDSTYRLEFFVSDACDPSGSGEGRTHLKTIQVDTDANGNADADLGGTPITAAVGQQVTMTATKLGNNDVPLSTSELSPCEVVQQ